MTPPTTAPRTTFTNMAASTQADRAGEARALASLEPMVRRVLARWARVG